MRVRPAGSSFERTRNHRWSSRPDQQGTEPSYTASQPRYHFQCVRPLHVDRSQRCWWLLVSWRRLHSQVGNDLGPYPRWSSRVSCPTLRRRMEKPFQFVWLSFFSSDVMHRFEQMRYAVLATYPQQSYHFLSLARPNPYKRENCPPAFSTLSLVSH